MGSCRGRARAIGSGAMLFAFLLFLAAGVSDAIDGFLAKRFGMTSEVGAYLVPLADKALIVSAYDITSVFGVVTRVAEYAAVGPDRAVIVTASGPQAAVQRHLDAVAAAAATARLKPTVPVPASTPGSGAGTDSTRSPK